MKILFHSLLAFCLLTTGALAQLGAGADSFFSATLVPPGGGSVNVDLRDYTLQLGEAVPSEHVKPHTAWWKWVPAEDGFCVIDTLSRNWPLSYLTSNSAFVAVYTGTGVGSLTRVGLSNRYRPFMEDNEDATLLRFYGQKGRTYYIQLSATVVSATNNSTRFSVRPFYSKPLRKFGSWSYENALEKEEFGGVNVLINPSGTLSGKLQLSNGSYPFTGVLDRGGYAKVSILPKQIKGGPPPEPITLQLAGEPGGYMAVEMPGNGYINVTPYDSLPTPAMPEGNWSGIFQYISPNTIEGPVMMKVKPNKTVSIVARGPDGVAMTLNAPILQPPSTELGGLSLLTFMNGGKSGLMAPLRFGLGTRYYLGNVGYFLRGENPKSVLYPTGLNTAFNTLVYPYTKPAAGQRALGFLDASAGVGRLRITDPTGELGGNADLPLTLGTNNKFVFTADPVRKPTLKLNITTGQVTGSIILGGKKRTIMGALRASATPRMSGYITGTTKNVLFSVEP